MKKTVPMLEVQKDPSVLDAVVDEVRKGAQGPYGKEEIVITISERADICAYVVDGRRLTLTERAIRRAT